MEENNGYAEPKKYLERFYTDEEQKVLNIELAIETYCFFCKNQKPPYTADTDGMREILYEIQGKKPKTLKEKMRELEESGAFL